MTPETRRSRKLALDNSFVRWVSTAETAETGTGRSRGSSPFGRTIDLDA
jgi:hypothetical protein